MNYTNIFSDSDICFTSKKEINPDDIIYNFHIHSDYELYCFVSGNVDYIVEGTAYHMQPGGVLLLRPGEIHKVRILSDAPYERYVIYFNRSTIESVDPKCALLKPYDERQIGTANYYPPEVFTGIKPIDIISEIDNSAPGSYDIFRARIISHLLAVLGKIYVVFFAKDKAEINETSIDSMLNYIDSHLGAEKLNSTLLSKKFYMSETELNRAFKRATGLPVGKYINIKRLILARDLLKKGMPANEVSLRCGFNDYSTFFRAYKKQFGANPKVHMS
ncbi:MAG: AraC family transcriptional regulator [Clostridia bacterium]|nr:AraC family transcriptional regulator [Clostridia bacterium]